MDLRQLEYLVAVADHGGFTRAAAAVHVSQPSLSHGIKTLEAELGIELFARLGRSVQATSAGESVIDSARRVLRDIADLSAAASAVSTVQVGSLELVALPTLAVDPLARLVGRFRALHPGVTIRVREPEDSLAIDQQVASGRAELGLTDLTTGGTGLVRIVLFRQQIVAVCPPGTVLADGPITPQVFAGLPIIATPVGTSTRRILDQMIAKSGAAPNIVVEISQREAIMPLVLAGAGASLLPTSFAADAVAKGAVVRELKPSLTRRIGLLHRPARLSPAAAAMVQLATSTLGAARRRPR